jgi:hypothetical protein
MFKIIKNYRQARMQKRATHEMKMKIDFLRAGLDDFYTAPASLRILLSENFQRTASIKMHKPKAVQAVFKREIRGLADDMMRLADEMERNG